MRHFLVLFCLLLPLREAFAEKGLQDGQGKAVRLAEIVARAQPGQVLVVGEEHDNAQHDQQRMQLLRALKAAGLRVGVGMEFLEFPDQAQVNAYRAGQLLEADFLKAVRWGSFDFKYYRGPILFNGGAGTRALNAPRELVAKLRKEGLGGLTNEEAALLPPQFTRGNDLYFERFLEAAGGHFKTPEAAERYFLAQSLWDDTMAFQTIEHLRRDPAQVFVIVVGGFHVQYGGGLPERLKARGHKDVVTLMQLAAGADPTADPKYGPQGDYVWVAAP